MRPDDDDVITVTDALAWHLAYVRDRDFPVAALIDSRSTGLPRAWHCTCRLLAVCRPRPMPIEHDSEKRWSPR